MNFSLGRTFSSLSLALRMFLLVLACAASTCVTAQAAIDNDEGVLAVERCLFLAQLGCRGRH
jgi:hypothetical protein